MKTYLALFITLLSVNSGIAQAKFVGDLGVAGEMVDLYASDSVEVVDAKLLTPANKIQSGLKVDTRMDVSNGVDYHLIGVASLVQVNGLNISAHRTAIGVQGTVIKNSADANVTGLKCSVYDAIAGGTSTCLEVSFPLPLAGTVTTGVKMSPPSFATDIVGISFAQNPQAYKYTVDHAGAPISMGTKNGVRYCLQFNDSTADLEYIKNCGTDTEQIVGKVKIIGDQSSHVVMSDPQTGIGISDVNGVLTFDNTAGAASSSAPHPSEVVSRRRAVRRF